MNNKLSVSCLSWARETWEGSSLVGPKGLLLLPEVIRDDKAANNGEVFKWLLVDLSYSFSVLRNMVPCTWGPISQIKDNTVGSRSTVTAVDYAYIAGFLDGDGSLMLQIKHRRESKRGWRFMVTICFYQDTRHEAPLLWLRRKLGIGYLSRRRDGITEVRINGYRQVGNILKRLGPYLRFKKIQAKVISRACDILSRTPLKLLTTRDKKILCDCLLTVQTQNYATRTKKTKTELWKIVGLTP